MSRIFLLSPATCSGIRAGYLLRSDGRSALARQLREDGASIGELFTFMSGLYFRGKLAYAEAFGGGPDAPLVIVPGRGIVPASTRVSLEELRAIAGVPVDPRVPAYLDPLVRDALSLATRLQPADQVVLLGSIATGKYLQPLLGPLSGCLFYPREFVGRGDMSRGALLLRAVRSRQEVDYVRADERAATGRKKG